MQTGFVRTVEEVRWPVQPCCTDHPPIGPPLLTRFGSCLGLASGKGSPVCLDAVVVMVRWIARCLTALCLGLLPGAASALDWQLLDPSVAKGYGTCQPDGAGYACLALVCNDSGPVHFGFELALMRPDASENFSRSALYRIDDADVRHTFVNPPKSYMGHEFSDMATLVAELVRASRVEVWQEGHWTFGLTGFVQALDVMLQQCSRPDAAPLTLADLQEQAKGFAKRSSERSPMQSSVFYSHDWVMEASVLAAGSAAPEDCLSQCLAAATCSAATIAPGNQCQLLTGPGVFRPAQGSMTAIIEKRATDQRQPAIPGPAPQIVTGLRWQTGDTVDTYLMRLRAASAPLGADCGAEAAAVDSLLPQLQLTPPALNQRVGVPFSIGWKAGGRMALRVPAWIIVTTDRPVRFTGDGFFGLLPGALGPFGLGHGADRHRAFVPLHEGTAMAGDVGVIPLDGGPLQVEVALVAWHRACQQERAAARSVVQLTVTPGDPQLVLHDPTAPDPYAQIVASPAFEREVFFGDGRVAIRDSRDGSEILARDGKDPLLSPTGRFLVLSDDRNAGANHIEIFDIMDGAKVQDLQADALIWWNADSFILTDSQPYGLVQAGAMALPRMFGDPLETGQSCCTSEGRAVSNVDLENGILGIADSVIDLTDGSDQGGIAVQTLDFKRGSTLSDSLRPWAFDRIGLVAPFEPEALWNMPLGPFTLTKPNDYADRFVPVALAAQPPTRPNAAHGTLMAAATTASATVFRGIVPVQGGPDLVKSFDLAMARWGVLLAEAQRPDVRFDLRQNLIGPSGQTESGTSKRDELLARRANLQAEIEADLATSGKYAVWAMQNMEEGYINYCEHSPSMWDVKRAGNEPALLETLKSESDYDLLHRYALPAGRVIWVVRSGCEGGATGGTLKSDHSLNIFDTARAEKNFAQFRVASYGTLRAEILHGFEGHFMIGFDSKLVGQRYLLTYAPGEAAVAVFDLATRRFVLKVRQSWRGDLLRDVYLDSAMGHLFALNSDGSFALYRLGDGKDAPDEAQTPALYGRYLDDELVAWTADYRFDATEEGAAFVELRFPGTAGQHSLDQLAAGRRVPGLLQAVLQGEAIANAAMPAPPPRLTGTLYRANGRVTGLVQPDAQAGLREVRIFADGRLAATVPRAGQGAVKVDVALPPGARWVSAVAIDMGGQSSRPLGFDLGPDPPNLPRTHFLAVGIDYYADKRLARLNFAKSDSARISNALGQLHGQTLNLLTNTILADRRASKEAVLAQLDGILTSAMPGDHVVLHFAGHGLRDAKGNFYLATSATNLADLAGTALRWADVAAAFQGHDLRITVLLDACHSGAAGSGAMTTNDGAVADLQRRMPPGLTIVAAAKGRQTSGEESSAGGGLFSAAIARVLTQERSSHDLNGNGVLEAVEFYRGVKSIVTTMRGSDQTPWLARNGAVGEYALF